MNEIYIYLIENKTNKKKYIGQSVNYQKRMKEHIYGRNSRQNSIVDRAIKKHGENNFSFSVIDIAHNQEEADEKERFYIKHYKSLKPNGYNVLIGGRNQQGSWNSKKVYMYNLNGEYIREFDSAQEVQRWSNSFYLRESVRDCCNGKINKCKDMIFCYTKQQKIKPYQKPISSRRKTVFQFDLKGNVLNSFQSIDTASKETNTSRTAILGCLKGHYKTANGFRWGYSNEIETICLVIERTHVVQLDDNYDIVNEFPSCSEAERSLGLRKGAYKTIYSVLNKNKKRYGYYWIKK